jgi:hypothetical protein
VKKMGFNFSMTYFQKNNYTHDELGNIVRKTDDISMFSLLELKME